MKSQKAKTYAPTSMRQVDTTSELSPADFQLALIVLFLAVFGFSLWAAVHSISG